MKKKVGIFTVHKSASMLLFKLAEKIATINNIDIYSANIKDKGNGRFSFPDFSSEASTEASLIYNNIQEGIISPIRRPLDANNDHKVVVVLRDPRDVMTSMFHSFTKIHGGISEDVRQSRLKMGVDKYVLAKSDDMVYRYESYVDKYHGNPNALFLSYEDMIVNTDGWLNKFLDHLPFDLNNTDLIYEFMTSETNVSAASENTHKRKMIPGDYKNNLSEETVEMLNKKFSTVIERLNYQL